MQPPSATELLCVWERGAAQTLPERALGLLAAGSPGIAPEELARLTIGRRDGHLLALRAQMFGPRLASLANCPACGARVELSFEIPDILATPGPGETNEFSLAAGEYDLRFRLPDSRDLMNLAGINDPARARERLLERCLLNANRQGLRIAVTELPEDVITVVTERMAHADPQADVQLALACPACARQWTAAFDIVSFLWSEIHAWASRLLREIHALASAYGWAEADLLGHAPPPPALLSGDAWRVSDYLNNLAARTLDPAPAIRPRLASMFESPALNNPPLLEQSLEYEPLGPAAARPRPAIETPAEERVKPETSAVRPALHAAPTPIKPLAPLPLLPVNMPPPPQMEAPVSKSGFTPPPPLAMPLMTREPSLTDPAIQTETAPPLLKPDSNPHMPPVSPKRPTPLIHSEENAQIRPQDHRPSPLQSAAILKPAHAPSLSSESDSGPINKASTPDDPEPHHRPAAEPEPVSKPRSPARIVVQPQVTKAIEPAPTAALEPSAPEKVPPAVHVTIGRIDVRAVSRPPAPAARTREARPSAVLSLDEYLKQRHAGSRR